MNYQVEYKNQNWEAGSVSADSPLEAARLYVSRDAESAWTDYDEVIVSWGGFGKNRESFQIRELLAANDLEARVADTQSAETGAEAPSAAESTAEREGEMDQRNPPPTFPDLLLQGKQPYHFLDFMLAGLMVVALFQGAGASSPGLLLGALLMIPLVVVPMIAIVIRRPTLALSSQNFSVAWGLMSFRGPAAEIADIRLEAGTVVIRFHRLDFLPSDRWRKALENLHKRHGWHLNLPPHSHTAAQIGKLRSALGIVDQVPDSREAGTSVLNADPREDTPAVTLALILLCGAVYCFYSLWRMALGNDGANWLFLHGAQYGPRTLAGEWWRLFTSLFLHANLVHLALNLWTLWQVGRVIERRVGSVATISLYFLAGVAGGMTGLVAHPQVMSVGASGAIFGLFGGLFASQFRSKDAPPDRKSGNLRNSIIIFVLLNLSMAGIDSRIDVAAHIGGLVAGFLGGLALPPARCRRRFLRLCLMVAGGTGALLLGWGYLPAPPRDMFHELSYLSETEARILGRYNQAYADYRQGGLSADALTKIIDTEILPDWRELGGRVSGWEREKFPGLSVPALNQYMNSRRQCWQDLTDALRENDQRRVENALQEQLEIRINSVIPGH